MSASTFLYASAVDTLTESGLQITMLSQRKEAIFLIAVPIPVQSFVPPSRQKGTSAPTFSPISLISAGLSIVPNILFKPKITAAPSLLPPARPACVGIFLSMSI